MAAKEIEKKLNLALLEDGEMSFDLYDDELAEELESLKESLAADHDDFIFAVTENRGEVAMLLIEASGNTYINEQARERLKDIWPMAYKNNMESFIPEFALELESGQFPITGVKIVR